MLSKLAKNMGVVTQSENFATFDIINDLEVARNCLFVKQQKKVNESIPLEIVEFISENDNSGMFEITDVNSDVEEMLIVQSNKKEISG